MSKERIKEWILCRAPGQKGPWNNLKRSRVPSEDQGEGALSIFFNYCVDKGWLESAHCRHQGRPPKACGDEVSLPEIFTPEQAESLLQAAQLLDDQRSQAGSPPAVPFFVLGLFCGLRPSPIWDGLIGNTSFGTRRNGRD